MTQLLANLDSIGDELTVYIPRGEDLAPNTRIVVLDEGVGNPPEDMVYLLEVGLIKDVIRVWRAWRGDIEPSVVQAGEAVSYYARHDAYQPLP